MNINWGDLSIVLGRSFISLALLFFITKMLGKKQVSQLSLFDYVIGISIGNFVAEMTVDLQIEYMNGVVSMLVFGLVAYLISFLTIKSFTLRKFFMGVPTILIQNGKLVQKNIKKVKFDINDLLEECRENGYFDLNEIEYGIMEANGLLSILPKAEYKPLTPKDMKVDVNASSLCANIIIDGHIIKKNLNNMAKNEEWINHELQVKGYKLEDILLATLDIDDKLTLFKRNEEIKVHDVLE